MAKERNRGKTGWWKRLLAAPPPPRKGVSVVKSLAGAALPAVSVADATGKTTAVGPIAAEPAPAPAEAGPRDEVIEAPQPEPLPSFEHSIIFRAPDPNSPPVLERPRPPPSVSGMAAAAAPKIGESPPEALDRLIAAISIGADYVFIPSHASLAEATAGARVQSAIAAVGGHCILGLSAGALDATPSGKTGGFSIRVPDTFELAASGAHIEIRVAARSSSGAANFAVAYSTNDVGNSGWRWFNLGAVWEIFTMRYKVPKMKLGKGDFIGLLPNPAGLPGIEVCAVAALVVQPRPPQTNA